MAGVLALLSGEFRATPGHLQPGSIALRALSASGGKGWEVGDRTAAPHHGPAKAPGHLYLQVQYLSTHCTWSTVMLYVLYFKEFIPQGNKPLVLLGDAFLRMALVERGLMSSEGTGM